MRFFHDCNDFVAQYVLRLLLVIVEDCMGKYYSVYFFSRNGRMYIFTFLVELSGHIAMDGSCLTVICPLQVSSIALFLSVN